MPSTGRSAASLRASRTVTVANRMAGCPASSYHRATWWAGGAQAKRLGGPGSAQMKRLGGPGRPAAQRVRTLPLQPTACTRRPVHDPAHPSHPPACLAPASSNAPKNQTCRGGAPGALAHQTPPAGPVNRGLKFTPPPPPARHHCTLSQGAMSQDTFVCRVAGNTGVAHPTLTCLHKGARSRCPNGPHLKVHALPAAGLQALDCDVAVQVQAQAVPQVHPASTRALEKG